MKRELTLGMTVSATDGRVGRLQRIVGDANSREPAYLVVRLDPPPRPRDVVVPVNLVDDVGDDGVALDATGQALRGFPSYDVEVERPLEKPLETPKEPSYLDRWPQILPFPTIWSDQGPVRVRERTVPEHMVDLRRGMAVWDSAGRQLGEIEGVVADGEKRQVSHVVLRRGHPLSDERRLIPIELVDFVIRSDVYLRLGEEYVAALPPYEPQR